MILKSQTTAFAPPPNPPIEPPGMTWAELARKEGHRGKLPANADASKITGSEQRQKTRLAILLAIMDGHCRRSEIEAVTGFSGRSILIYVREMKAAGWIKTHRPQAHIEMKITPTKRGVEEAGKL